MSEINIEMYFYKTWKQLVYTFYCKCYTFSFIFTFMLMSLSVVFPVEFCLDFEQFYSHNVSQWFKTSSAVLFNVINDLFI